MIISDIDGTIANRGVISDRTWAAIEAVAASGIRFAVATGRAAGLLKPVDDRGYSGVAICDNGAVTYDVGRHQIIACELLDSYVVGEVATAISESHPELYLGISRVSPDPRSIFSEARQLERFDFGQQALEIASFGEFPAAKMWAWCRDYRSSEIVELVRPIVGDRLEVGWSSDGSGLVEMTARGVTKASACDALTRRWGVTPADVVVMGDMANDLEMLEWGGTAIVPANGSDDAKARADEIVGHIEEDGTAAYLESLVR